MDELNKLTIDVEGRKVSFGELYAVEEAQLSEAFATQASKLAFVGSRAAVAEVVYTEAKQHRERTYADIELDYRDQLAKANEKFTEGKIRSLVLSDEEYIEAQLKENAALKNYKVLKSMTDAMKQRGDMLISLGATLRQEFDVTNMQLLQTKEKLRRTRNGED